MVKQKELQQTAKYWEKQYSQKNKEYLDLFANVRRFERAKRKNNGNKVYFEDLVIEEIKKSGIDIPLD